MRPGDVVGGDFKIVRPLSSGGMGSVFVAEQLSTGRRRAVKVMLPGLVSDPKMRERFVQEARISATIESDHVVEVVAAGVDATTGAPFLAMELLSGEDLAHHLARTGALAPSAASLILAQLCHGVGAAHARGIVHRDLKPDNVFLAESRRLGAELHVKILDFGIAKSLAGAASQATQSMGTPLWMAPEQSDGKARVSPATDVWALGLIAFQMLAGGYYWNAAIDSDSSVHALLREVILDEIEAPSARLRRRGVRVALPEGFDAWFLRAVARDPGRRFPNARDAFDALRPVLASRGRGIDATIQLGAEDIEPVDDAEELLDADVVEGGDDALDRALTEARAAFAKAPRQANHAREILALASARGERDLAWRAATLLATFKSASAADEAVVRDPPLRAVLGAPLDDGAWRVILHPDLPPALVAVLAAVAAPLARASAARSVSELEGAYPIDPAIAPREPLAALARAAALLGVASPRLFVKPAGAAPIAIAHGAPATCVASAAFFAILSPAQALFVAVRSLARLRPELYAAHFFGTIENLKNLVTSIAEATGRAAPSSGDTASIAAMLRQSLHPSETTLLRSRVDALLSSSSAVDVGRTIRGAHATAARAALLVTGDPKSALREITRTPPPAGVMQVDDVVDDLLRFWLGDVCGALRARHGSRVT